MNQTPFPLFYAPNLNWGTNAASDMFTKVGDVYKQLAQEYTAELWTSSARIIQEHATRAFIESSQACTQALLQNAAEIQQQAFSRLAGANQKAADIVTHEMNNTVTAALTAE